LDRRGLQIHPGAVLIVENKEPALAWSDTTGLVIIHSLGNHRKDPREVPGRSATRQMAACHAHSYRQRSRPR